MPNHSIIRRIVTAIQTILIPPSGTEIRETVDDKVRETENDIIRITET